jgi:hypothetical protein
MKLEKWGVGRGEYEHYEDDEGKEWLWAFCEVPSCSNNVCVRINDRFCWPHLMSGGEVVEIIREDELEK